MSDMINGPAHYGGTAVMDAIDALGAGPAFCLGNAVKYILRAGKKGNRKALIADLNKAGWYVHQYHHLVSVDGNARVFSNQPMGERVDVSGFALGRNLRFAFAMLEGVTDTCPDLSFHDAMLNCQQALRHEIVSYVDGKITFPAIPDPSNVLTAA